MFFTYNQSNPGGRFDVTDSYGHCLCIEADSPSAANRKAEAIIGGDLEGERWGVMWREDQGTKKPLYYNETHLLKMEDFFMGEEGFPVSLYAHPFAGNFFVVDIYYANGKHKRKKYDVAKLCAKGDKERQRKADKLWATCINLSGVYSDKPVRVYKSVSLDDYYDREGNFSVPGPGYTETDYAVIYFASKDKHEVVEFIDGAKSMQRTLTDLAEKELNSVKGTHKRSGAKSVVDMVKRWARGDQ